MQDSLYALIEAGEKLSFIPFSAYFSLQFLPFHKPFLQLFKVKHSFQFPVVLTIYCNLCLCPFDLECNITDTYSGQIYLHYSKFSQYFFLILCAMCYLHSTQAFLCY